MKRALALVAAIAMVVFAVAIRSALDGDDGTRPGGDGGSGERATVLCAAELASACQEIVTSAGASVTVVVEPGWDSVERFVAAEAGAPPTASTGDGAEQPIAAWIAPAPLVEIVAERRSRDGSANVLDPPAPTLARSPLVLVGWTDRLDVLAEQCDDEVSWRCIGEVADTPWSSIGGSASWGDVKPGHPDPSTSAAGLLSIGQAAADWFGTVDYASNDFSEPGFREWFTRLERSVEGLRPPTGTPLERLLATGPASYDIVAALEAEAIHAVARSRDRGRLDILYPSPVITYDVVVVPVTGSPAGGSMRELFESDEAGDVLVAEGWRRPDGAPPEGADGAPTVDTDNPAPSPGVLQALRSLWQEVT